jgi:hypothetical protein
LIAWQKISQQPSFTPRLHRGTLTVATPEIIHPALTSGRLRFMLTVSKRDGAGLAAIRAPAEQQLTSGKISLTGG